MSEYAKLKKKGLPKGRRPLPAEEKSAVMSSIRKSRSLAAVLALFCSINTQKSLLNFAKQNLRLFCPNS